MIVCFPDAHWRLPNTVVDEYPELIVELVRQADEEWRSMRSAG